MNSFGPDFVLFCFNTCLLPRGIVRGLSEAWKGDFERHFLSPKWLIRGLKMALFGRLYSSWDMPGGCLD